MSMQMDAYLKKEQIGTLFVWVGALEGGGGGALRGVHPKKYTCHPKKKLPPEGTAYICCMFILLFVFDCALCVHMSLADFTITGLDRLEVVKKLTSPDWLESNGEGGSAASQGPTCVCVRVCVCV